MAEYTSAAFLQNPAEKTKILVRFSLAGSMRGAADTSRDIRGFAVKFYTKAGIFDLVGNHIPVFFIHDAIKFPDTIAALSPSPVNNLPDPERFWGFVAQNPEALHMVVWLYSDWGTVKSFRHINGHSVSTFVWKNLAGKRRLVKYHWLTMQGERCISRQEAAKLAASNPDVAGQELYQALAQGESTRYQLCVQLMEPEEAAALPYDPLDDTKLWDVQQYPLMPVGELVLTENPRDYGAEVESAAFSPANLVEGIELSADKMLQGRSFIYWDAQRHRLGKDFRQIPVNHMPGWQPSDMVTSGNGVRVCGYQERSGLNKSDDFTQAGQYYMALSPTGRQHLAENIALELVLVKPQTRACILSYLNQVHQQLKIQVEQAMLE